MEVKGLILDADYVSESGRSVMRLSVKSGSEVKTLFDEGFKPYFCLIPNSPAMDEAALASLSVPDPRGRVSVDHVERCKMMLLGRQVDAFRVFTIDARNVPILKEYVEEFGRCYEYDIPFWKRYLIDKDVSPMYGIRAEVHESGGHLAIDSIEACEVSSDCLTHVCFDIETYNPRVFPNMERDPVIMISFADGKNSGVISTKPVNKDIILVKSEKEMVEKFAEIVNRGDYDIIAGYNSSNFDIPYLLKRAERTRTRLDIGRYGEPVHTQHHGLVDSAKIPGRIGIDVYNVAKFVATVGTAEYLIKVNRFTLGEIYRAITGKVKKTVNKGAIFRVWDNGGKDLEDLAEYSLDDSVSLNELYDFFMPLEMEVARLCGTTLNEASVSTTGQLVEYLLMKYAHRNNEIVQNRPTGSEIAERMDNPFEGAYVKTPVAGIYERIAVLDFRGLYPSIIIAHNIDPSTILKGEGEYYESPTGVRFAKEPMGIMPKVLKLLISERESVKKAYKKNPENKSFAARSQALKILANSFYGYLGYARSRWYSRECGSSVTAFARDFIKRTIDGAEQAGFSVLYGDTDSVFLLMADKTKEDVLDFLKKTNSALPTSMELELDDFYTRGVFVGKKGGDLGAKKKYALLSESGKIKIRGFEFVRRDWSPIARDTQKRVLESILKEGSKEKAIAIVKETLERLKSEKVELKDLVIYTQLRKGIDSYDSTSPELAAARAAVKRGKSKEEVEGAMVGYVITKHGSSISEKAQLEEYATDYDVDYYVNHQVIPATLKILKELGISEEELTGNGTQKRLM